MRQFLPLALLVVAGCGSGIGPVQRRPGGNIALPKYTGIGESILRELACVAQQKDSARKGRGTDPTVNPGRSGCQELILTPPRTP